jgi:hypothetical protein
MTTTMMMNMCLQIDIGQKTSNTETVVKECNKYDPTPCRKQFRILHMLSRYGCGM